MTLTHPIRFAQALLLAAIVAALAAPAVLGGSNAGQPAPDWIERYAAAHPFGSGAQAVLGSSDSGKPAPDWFERYAAAHPFGKGAFGSAQALDVFERYAAARGVTVLANG